MSFLRRSVPYVVSKKLVHWLARQTHRIMRTFFWGVEWNLMYEGTLRGYAIRKMR